MGIEDISIDEAATLLQKYYPDIWKRINVKFIENPGSHAGFKAVAVSLASVIVEVMYDSRVHTTNIAACAGILEQYNFPTYYVSKDLLTALTHTNPPESMKWSEVFLPFESMIFMLPTGVLKEPDGSNVVYLGVCKFDKNSSVTIPGTKLSLGSARDWASGDSRITVFWAVRNCLTSQNVTFDATQTLAPDPNWINEKTNLWAEKTGLVSDAVDSNVSSYFSGIVANLLLVMQARKELVEKGERTGKTLKSGLSIHKPNYVGRKYQIIRQSHISKSQRQSQFTEIGWRSGCIKRQHYGKGNEQVKMIMVDPYIAFTSGLVKKAAS